MADSLNGLAELLWLQVRAATAVQGICRLSTQECPAGELLVNSEPPTLPHADYCFGQMYGNPCAQEHGRFKVSGFRHTYLRVAFVKLIPHFIFCSREPTRFQGKSERGSSLHTCFDIHVKGQTHVAP